MSNEDFLVISAGSIKSLNDAEVNARPLREARCGVMDRRSLTSAGQPGTSFVAYAISWVTAIIKKNRSKLEKAFRSTSLQERGLSFEDVAQFIFARVQRRARKRLEDEGVVTAAKAHRNGVD